MADPQVLEEFPCKAPHRGRFLIDGVQVTLNRGDEVDYDPASRTIRVNGSERRGSVRPRVPDIGDRVRDHRGWEGTVTEIDLGRGPARVFVDFGDGPPHRRKARTLEIIK